MFTALALIFVALILGAIYYSYGVIMKKPPTEEDLRTEKCSLCRRNFNKSELLERAVGDSRLYYFCHDCIRKLYDEIHKEQT